MSAVLAGLERLAETVGVDLTTLLERTERFGHGTTIGTSAVLEIPVSTPVDGSALLADFEKEYVRRYGEGGTSLFQAVEVFALRARVSVAAGIPLARAPLAASTEPARTDVYWPRRGWTDTVAYRGAPRDAVTGPVLVELAHTTVAVPPGATLTVGPLGELHLKEF